MKQRVLVTGGLGYIGCHVVRELIAGGHDVVVLDLMLYHERSPLQHPNLTVVRGDVRDEELVSGLLGGRSAIIHLAGISLDGVAVDPKAARAINIDSFATLVRQSVLQGVERCVLASSCSVYGDARGTLVAESTQPRPCSAYAEAKLECETILQAASSDLYTTVVRAATVCGTSPRQRLDLLVNRMVTDAVVRGKVTVENGESVRPSVHVLDLSRAYRLLIEAPEPRVSGKTFNVGFQNRTIQQTAQLVAGITGARIRHRSAQVDDARSYSVDSRRIGADLSFLPERGVRDAVLDLAEALRGCRLRNPLTDPQFYNRLTEAAWMSHSPAAIR